MYFIYQVRGSCSPGCVNVYAPVTRNAAVDRSVPRLVGYNEPLHVNLTESIEEICDGMMGVKALPLSNEMQRRHRVTVENDGDDREMWVVKGGDCVDKE